MFVASGSGGPSVENGASHTRRTCFQLFASLNTRMFGHCLLCQFFWAGGWWLSTRKAARGTIVSPCGLFQRAPDCALSERRRQLLEHIFCAGGQCLRFGSRAQKMPRPYVLFKQVPFFARRVCITLAIFFLCVCFPRAKRLIQRAPRIRWLSCASERSVSKYLILIIGLRGALFASVRTWPPVEQHAHIRTLALSAVGARADVNVGSNTDLDADADVDADRCRWRRRCVCGRPPE